MAVPHDVPVSGALVDEAALLLRAEACVSLPSSMTLLLAIVRMANIAAMVIHACALSAIFWKYWPQTAAPEMVAVA